MSSRGPQPVSVPAAFFRSEKMMLGGIGVAFGVPLLCGLGIRVALWLGADLGGAVSTIRLLAALAEVAILVGVVTVGERRRLGSVGIRQPTVADLKDGLVLAAICCTLAIVVLSMAAPIPSRLVSLYRGSFVVAVLTLAAVAIAQELGMRGFAASRLRTFSGSALVGGAAALALSLVANVPLWGLAYTIELAPVEALLVGFFLWKRRLLPCVVANFAVGVSILALITFAATAPVSPAATTHAPSAAKPPSEHEQAIDKLKRLLESKISPAAPFVERAIEDAKHGDYDKAKVEMGKAIDAEPSMPGLYVYRGDLYSAQNRHDAAVADYSKAIALAPGESAPYRKRGDEYMNAGNDESAHRDFAKAIALTPDDADGYVDRSALYVRERRYDEALRDVSTGIKLEPNRYDFILRRVGILQLMHRYDDAIGDCNRIIAMDSSAAEGFACRAQQETVKGDRARAIADLGELLKRAPNTQEALVTRADLELQTEQWGAARADLVALSSVNSVDAETADWCAFTLATSVHPELRDGRAAVALATRACEATQWNNVKYLETLAASYAESGEFAQAIRWQEQAIRVAQATDPSLEQFLRWQLNNYNKGLPYREDESGAVTQRSTARYILALVATLLALIGLVTVIAMLGRFVFGGRRATA